jgi:hypothetical protein
MCEIQLPWSEDESFNQATILPHPSEAEPIIPDRTKNAIIEIPTGTPEEWKMNQKAKLSRIHQRAKELAPEEKYDKQHINPAVHKVNHLKQIILTAKVLKEMQYGDLDVAHRLLTGPP